MGVYQKFRGNPENKLFFLLNNFMGGINTEFSDDSSNDTDFDSIINFDMDKLGTLNKRGGFGELTAISEIFNKLDVESELPNIKNRTDLTPNPENENDNVVYMKLLRNDNNCFRALSGFSGENAYRKYQEMYGFQNNKFILLLITTKNSVLGNTSTAWLYQCSLPELEYNFDEITDTETMTITCNKINLPVIFNWNRNLMNLDTIEFYDKIYFTDNNKCLISFDRSVEINSDEDLESAFSYSGYTPVEGEEIVNSAYIPSGLEVRHIGFNILRDDPMHSIDTQGLSTDSIQGLFVCTLDNIPLQSLPLGQKFLLNIIYTGTDNGFNIEIKEGEANLSFDLLVNSNLSQTGLKVYEVTFKDVPSGEVEIKITKNQATIEPYYDYYNVAKLDTEAKPVSKLNVGDYGICEMYNRAVYYKNDTIWFSEVNNFNYIPNYNYVTLPIEPTDKITKICYFKKAYIIFTTQRIYKMTGAFGTNEFAVSPVNMSLGCHAGNTVVPIEDILYFASPRGLYALRSSQFVEGYENVKELDLKVKKLTSDFTKYSEELSDPSIRFNGISERAYALRYKDKYLLFYNNYSDKGDYAAVNNLDVLAYQFDIGAYTTYRFKEKPTFLFMVDNAIETLATVMQKQEHIEQNVLFNYDFSNVEGNVVTDLSGNNNNANIKGDLKSNMGIGVKFDGIDDNIKIDHFSGNIQDNINIEIETKLSSLNGAVLLSLQQSQPSVDKIKGSLITKETVGYGYQIIFDYEITPNPITLNDTVSYKISLYRAVSLLDKTINGSVNFRVSPVLNSSTVNFHFTKNMSSIMLKSGTFTISRNSNGTYSELWELSGNLNVSQPSTTYQFYESDTISLEPAVGEYNEIVLKQDNLDKLILEFYDGNSITKIETPTNIGLLERHNWIFNIDRINEYYYEYSIKKDNVEIISGGVSFSRPFPNNLLKNINRDLCYLGTNKNKEVFLNGELYKLSIKGSDENLLNYNFTEGVGTTIYDKTSYHIKGILSNGVSWLRNTGLNFKGDGYLELPEFRDIYLSNGFKIEFRGKIGVNSQIARIIDLADRDKKYDINLGVKDNVLIFNSSGDNLKSYKLQTNEINFSEINDYTIDCTDNGNGYTIKIMVNNEIVMTTNFEYGGIKDISRLSNFIGKSNTSSENNFIGILKSFKFTIYESNSLVPIYRSALYEFDTTSTDFGKPIYLELKTKGINMNYPQHLKKLKHIFVKAIGGYKYGELFFTLFGDGYIVNDPRIYSYYIDENGTVVQNYEDIKDLKIDERISLLGNMRLNKTKLGEGTYQTRKLIIPKKCKNFTLLIYGESEDYISLESFGFVVKLGKVKEG